MGSENRAVTPTNSILRPFVVLCGLVLLGALHGRFAAAEEFTQSFDGDEPSWTTHYQHEGVKLLSHDRQARVVYSGNAAESAAFEASQEGGLIQLEHDLPPARVFNELKLSLWVRSNLTGAALFLRVVLPRQQDPSTGEALVTFVRGDGYTALGQWQRLECTTPDKQIRERLVLLRARLKQPNIDTREMYVDRAILTTRLRQGSVEFYLDELRFGPVVRPQLDANGELVPDAPDHPSLHTPPPKEEGLGVRGGAVGDGFAASPVEFRLDRLQVQGRPFFPRMAAYHGESLNVLKESGLNVVWVSDYENESLLSALRQEGLWAAAIPPRAVSTSAKTLDARQVGLVPFSEKTAPILMWYLGTRISPDEKDDLSAWYEQIRNADLHYKRPVMADVTGGERVYSRKLEMLGVSRHVLGTSFSLQQYRDWLIQKRKLAQRGSFLWTWIQTEPVSSRAERRQAAHKAPIVVEPEQIRLQVYAALAAGCRGIGFWKTTSLDDDVPGAYERRSAITELNLELGMLEPWLAGGTLVGQVPFEIQQPTERTSDRGKPTGATPMRSDAERRNEGTELEAAVIRGERGTLLLPIWYQHGAQYVPGQMAANNATIVVPGVEESASAWEISPTGIRSLNRKRVTGGLRITLDKFNQTAAIVLSADRQLRPELERRIADVAPLSARVSLDLAKAKLVRVRQVDGELDDLGVGQPDAPQLLAKAKLFVDAGEKTYERGDYQGARELSENALQLLRILQRAHWANAVRNMSDPASSPDTICFQTLPDHWRMVGRLGRSADSRAENLLRSGDFEDIDTMIAEGWQHTQNSIDGVRAAAELYPVAREGRYSLRLIAVPDTGQEAPTVIRQNPVTVTTPPVTVRAGQVVYISGWVRVAAPITHSLDGALLYDNLIGPLGALRWNHRSGWQRFVLLRDVPQSGELTLTIALTGLGEIQFDDLRIIPHNPPGESRPAETADKSPEAEKPQGSAFDFLNRLPRLNPLAPRR